MTYLPIPDAFSPAECTRITAATEAADAAEARLVRGDRAHNIRRAELVWLDDLPDMGWVTDRLIDVVREANRHFRFDLDAMRESPQVARYTADREGHFDWHSDIGDGTVAALRKLTLVVQLSAPEAYDGGTLELRPSVQPIVAPTVQGSAVAFPAFVLHRVAPVTRGTRNSLTIWSHGPALQRTDRLAAPRDAHGAARRIRASSGSSTARTGSPNPWLRRNRRRARACDSR